MASDDFDYLGPDFDPDPSSGNGTDLEQRRDGGLAVAEPRSSPFFEHWFVRKYLAFVMIGLAVAVGATAVMLRTGGGGPAVADVIEELVPAPNDEVLAQNPVSIDLIAGYTARLQINGVDIPESQLRRVEALNQVTFQPDEGKVIEALRADVNCATAFYWPLALGEEAGSPFTWCFNAT